MTPLPFLEKLLQVLGHGGFSSTYKYAVLLALIDLCVEAGQPPTVLTTAQLARRVVELYWPQARRFPSAQRVLKQNNGEAATILRLVAEYRANHPDRLSPPTGLSPPADFVDVLVEVEWVLVHQPLPKLQKVGGGEERFLYTISWDETVSRKAFTRGKRGLPDGLDNRLLMMPGAAASLVALAAVIRPLVQSQWLAKVRALNGLPDAELDDFLFGARRVDLGALRGPLRDLQEGQCFYCSGNLSRGPTEVDHFLPWARYPDDGLDNLLLAHGSCNQKKLHYLADLDFARRWAERSEREDKRLSEIALAENWGRDRARTFGVVASSYQSVTEGIRLWQGGEALRRLSVEDLSPVMAFGRGLVGGQG